MKENILEIISLRNYAWLSGAPGMWAIVRKEMGDHFNGFRFIILFFLIGAASISAVYVAAITIRETVAAAPEMEFVFLWLFTTSGRELPPFTSFVGFLAPLVGIALGFDAVNGEQARGTLGNVLSQPLHRDAFINGKFLAGLVTIALMLLGLFAIVGGLGLTLIGVPPLTEEVLRIFALLVLSVIYVAFWLSLAVLFSILFRQTATSALAGIASWLFFTIFYGLLTGLLSNALLPVHAGSPAQEILRNQQLHLALARVSPTTLYYEAASMLLIPHHRVLGPVLMEQISGAIPGALPFGQSLVLIWPHFAGLLAMTLLAFAISYIIFIKTEIRAS